MENTELFLGFLLTPDFLDKFQKLNPQVCSLFIQKHSDYLQKVILDNQIFIGKFVGQIADLDKLELVETHIFSILKKLVSDYNFENDSLVLFPHVQ